MEKMEIAIMLCDKQFADMAGFLASDANLIEESKNNDGYNPPQVFASLIRSERDENHCHRVTLEVGVAYDWRESSHMRLERRMVPGKYLRALVEAIGFFPK